MHKQMIFGIIFLLNITINSKADSNHLSYEFTSYKPWPSSPKVELVLNKDKLLIRSPEEIKAHLESLKLFEDKFKGRIKGYGGSIKNVQLATDFNTDQLTSWEELVFAKYGQRALLIDVYRPKGMISKLPVVIFIHGGGWKQGTRNSYRPMAKKMALKGFVSATIEYRLAGEATFPAAVQDIKAAIRFLRSQEEKFQLDTNAFGICGGSAGGHLSLLTGYTNNIDAFEGNGGSKNFSSRIQAVASFYGATDFTGAHFANRGMNPASSRWLAVPFHENPNQYIQASPIHHVTKERAIDIPHTLFITPYPLEHHANVPSSIAWLERCGLKAEEAHIRAPHGFIYMHPFQDQAIETLASFFKKSLTSKSE